MGPGGVPEGVSLVAELESRWQPPPPLSQAPQPGSAAPPVILGQVSGDYMPCSHARPRMGSTSHCLCAGCHAWNSRAGHL